jgi:hypothetical protein
MNVGSWQQPTVAGPPTNDLKTLGFHTPAEMFSESVASTG